MIRIRKPAEVPAILRSKGVAATLAHCQEYLLEPEAYARQKTPKTFKFKATIYACKAVKDLLRRAQHDKCALCESKVSHTSYGDVDHFRPKAGYRQSPGDALTTPGYYWLAYEWSNLLFCCQLCNQRFKKNHFPLANESDRARSHHDDIANEDPLLVNPAIEDPAHFIEFRENIVHAVRGNVRGRTTIDAYGLNRKELEEMRLASLFLFRNSIPVVLDLIDTRDAVMTRAAEHPTAELIADLRIIESQIERFFGDSAQYAAMVRSVLQNSGR